MSVRAANPIPHSVNKVLFVFESFHFDGFMLVQLSEKCTEIVEGIDNLVK